MRTSIPRHWPILEDRKEWREISQAGRWMREITECLWRKEDKKKRKPTPSQLFINSDEWKQLRKQADAVLPKLCSYCGATDYLQIDHIKPRYYYPELAMELNNLQRLCWPCNRKKATHDQ